jgi:hypothetical protein
MPQRFSNYVLTYGKKDLNDWPTLAHKSPVTTCSNSALAKAAGTGAYKSSSDMRPAALAQRP